MRCLHEAEHLTEVEKSLELRKNTKSKGKNIYPNFRPWHKKRPYHPFKSTEGE
jgi:hypothetical protein